MFNFFEYNTHANEHLSKAIEREDDYIYSKLYSSNYKGAYILNSPIIHFEAKTTVEKGGLRDCSTDKEVFDLLELDHKNLTFNKKLSKWKPEFTKIKLNIKTLLSKS